jgi:hypothetical protein
MIQPSLGTATMKTYQNGIQAWVVTGIMQCNSSLCCQAPCPRRGGVRRGRVAGRARSRGGGSRRPARGPGLGEDGVVETGRRGWRIPARWRPGGEGEDPGVGRFTVPFRWRGGGGAAAGRARAEGSSAVRPRQGSSGRGRQSSAAAAARAVETEAVRRRRCDRSGDGDDDGRGEMIY